MNLPDPTGALVEGRIASQGSLLRRLDRATMHLFASYGFLSLIGALGAFLWHYGLV